MSYSEKIKAAQDEATDITLNRQLSVEQLDRIYRECKVIYVCHDGKIVDTLTEDGDEEEKKTQSQ